MTTVYNCHLWGIHSMGRAEASKVHFVGQFLSYDLKGCEIHRICLGDADGKYCFKLNSKTRKSLLQAALQGEIQVGDWLRVAGSQTSELPKTSKVGRSSPFKIKTIKRVSAPRKAETSSKKAQKAAASKNAASKNATPTIKVSVCQKSGCCKRGGKAMYKTLTQTVKNHGLSDRVHIKATGCLGKCGKGPNIMVNKTRHHHMRSEDVAKVLATYCP